MAEQTIFDKLTNIANAIRVKTGGTETLSLEEMSTELNGIPNNDSSDLTVSGPKVTVPAGHYKNGASKSVATATQATPSISIDSAGKITASATQTAGYVTASTKSATKQMTTQAAKTVTPSTSSQTAVAKNVYTTGVVTVAAIPSVYQDAYNKIEEEKSAAPADVLSGETFIGAAGVVETGTMANNGAVSGTLDATYNSTSKTYTNTSRTIPAGYTSGGSVNISVEEKSVTPTASTQTIKPTSGKVLGKVTVGAIATETKTATPKTTSQSITPTSGKYLTKVTVNAIPSNYVDTTTLTATTGTNTNPSHVLEGKQFIGKAGTIEEGEMPNSTTSTTLAANGSYTIPAGYHDGTGKVTQSLTNRNSNSLSVNGATVTAPAGYYATAASKSVATVADVSKTLDATYNSTSKTYTNTSYTIPAGYHSGSGKVSITLEEKSATPSTSVQTITPTSGKVLSKVTVASIPSDYVKPTATLAAKTYTPSTSAQTIAAGTYLSGVQTISAVPTQSKSATPSTSTQTIKPDTGKFLSSVSVGAIATETKSVTPTTSAQDVTPTSGKYLTKVSVGAISTQTKSATPTTSSQTIKPDSGKYLSSVTVGAIPSTYVKPSATKAAATITPGTTNQTIAAGTYCSGAQTIAGDADLVSANIKAGANIFGVAGNANVVDTSAGTATAAQILSGKIAFVDGKKITGTIATLSADATGSGDGVHHTSEYNPHYGALSTGDTNKYVYTFIPPNKYIGSVNYIRVPEAKVASAIGLTAAKILSGTSILGVAGTFPAKPIALLVSAAATSGTGGANNASGLIIDSNYGSVSGGVFTASKAGTYYVASTYLANTKFGSGSYQGNSYTAVNNSSGTSVANKSVSLSSGGTVTITSTASKSSSSNTNGGSYAARAVVIYYVSD